METCIVSEVKKFEEVEDLFRKAHQEGHTNSQNYNVDQMRERWEKYLLFTVVTFEGQVVSFAGIYPFGKNLVRVADRLYTFPFARQKSLSNEAGVKFDRPAVDYIIPYHTKWAKEKGYDCFYSIQQLKKRNSLIRTVELLDPTLGYSVLPGLYLNIFENPNYPSNWQNVASTTKKIHLPRKIITDTAFIIGNGESRNIFPIQELKDKGIVYGCNAIYRDYPQLCDHIVAVNDPMYNELKKWYDKARPFYNRKSNLQIHGPNDISKWNYICTNDKESDIPFGLKLYRIWRGGDIKKGNAIRTIDFTNSRGTGCSAILMAAESGIKNIVILAFDIMGAKQAEYQMTGQNSREQNNIYKNTINYPTRMSMKAYLKYEWMFQIRQIVKQFPETDFYFINRREYLDCNTFLRWYFDKPNIHPGIYADLRRWVDGDRDKITWKKL